VHMEYTEDIPDMPDGEDGDTVIIFINL
jgi:hypothetical protein